MCSVLPDRSGNLTKREITQNEKKAERYHSSKGLVPMKIELGGSKIYKNPKR
jgi:hypothetical protein